MQFPRSFDAHAAESRWYPYWLEHGFFSPGQESGESSANGATFCVAMPPPNVTGVLHMGHALDSTLQDIVTRYKRMRGFKALWIPGTDHAGIATQTVVERHLLSTQGKRRQDFGREEFLSHVWSWKQAHESRIQDQIVRLGCSCDWTKYSFTLDEKRSLAVNTVFKQMFDDGLIYQGDYLVNWDPVSQTAIADDEVEYEEQKSSLWYFRYPLAEGGEFIEVATTRPETILGDTAIAVSPKDLRYAHLIGKKAVVPFIGREIPIIADDSVDPAFGTGAVKITPAHDPSDYQMGLRHKLPQVSVFTKDGKINESGKNFAGLTIAVAREQIVSQLQSLGLLTKIVPHMHRVGVSYRSKAVIEPFISKQWFVRVEPFKEELIRAVREKQVTILPPEFEAHYYRWIENLHDWCISRQLWWGHRIPVWTHKEDSQRKVCCADAKKLPEEVSREPEKWQQEEDVLDTWFSSSLWPFSIMGWPEQTADLKTFFPLSLIITGHDILFFWIARMIMMSKYVHHKEPFKQAYIHGLIFGKSYWRDVSGGGIAYVTGDEKLRYDSGEPLPKDVHVKWEKMSKSKGNVIDPMQIISQFGCDATRMTLASLPNSHQIDLELTQFQDKQRFVTKIWNGASFVLNNVGSALPLSQAALAKGINPTLLGVEDFWIFNRLRTFTQSMNQSLEALEFDKASYESFQFFWNDFCSVYLELSKAKLSTATASMEMRENKQKVMVVLLNNILRLLHPTMPFITEEIFGHLKELFPNIIALAEADPVTKEACRAFSAPSIMVSSYPQAELFAGIQNKEKEFALLQNISQRIGQVLVAANSLQIPSMICIQGGVSNPIFSLLQENPQFVTSFYRKAQLRFMPQETLIQEKGVAFTVDGVTVTVIPPAETVLKQKEMLVKKLEYIVDSIQRLDTQLASLDFLSRAKSDHVQAVRTRRAELALQEKDIREALRKIS